MKAATAGTKIARSWTEDFRSQLEDCPILAGRLPVSVSVYLTLQCFPREGKDVNNSFQCRIYSMFSDEAASATAEAAKLGWKASQLP